MALWSGGGDDFSVPSMSACLASAVVLTVMPQGMTTTWRPATRGGRIRPLLSPWTMIITPMVRVVRPHEFCCNVPAHICIRPYVRKASAATPHGLRYSRSTQA